MADNAEVEAAAEKVVVPDAVTGEFKEVPRSEAPGSIAKPRLAATLPPAPEISPRGLTRALDPDEASDQTYTTTIQFAGYWFYINEMSRDALKAYADKEKQWVSETQAAGTGPTDDIDAAIQKGEDITDSRQAIDEGVALSCIVDWTRPKPFTPDALKAMYPSAKSKLATQIITKSRLSRAEGDF